MALSPRRLVGKIIRNWRKRHVHRFNIWIHAIGIPLTVVGVVLLFWTEWYWGVGALTLGYVLQFAGHAVEGNDAGEWVAIKKLLGLPAVAISPHWQPPPPRP